jgi:hypothetical protein
MMKELSTPSNPLETRWCVKWFFIWWPFLSEMLGGFAAELVPALTHSEEA